jgi:hypothetical protein
MHPTSHVRTRQSQLNFTHPEESEVVLLETARLLGAEKGAHTPGLSSAGDRYPDEQLASLPARHTVLLRPGDLLFLPAFVFHQVLAETNSLSVNAFRPSMAADAIHSLRLLGVPRSVLGKRRKGDDIVPAALAALLARLARMGARLDAPPGPATSSARAFLERHLLIRYHPLRRELDGCSSFEARQCPALALLPADEMVSMADHVADLKALLNKVYLSASSATGQAGGEEQGRRSRAPLHSAKSYAQGLRLALLANYMDDLIVAVIGPDRACLFLQCLVEVWA